MSVRPARRDTHERLRGIMRAACEPYGAWQQPEQQTFDAGSSRAATNDLLGALRTRGCQPTAWPRFLAAATRRSAEQASLHRRALGEATVLHGLFLVLGRGSGRSWLSTSWMLTALHLGLLEERSHLGVANTLTLVRANLPVTGRALGPWLGLAAAATDFVDGKLARHTATTTAFGRYADPLADAAFWTWIAFAGDDDRTLRAAVVLTWLLPIVSVTTISVSRGQMIEAPRPHWIRPAALLQLLIALRTLRRRPGDRSRRTQRSASRG